MLESGRDRYGRLHVRMKATIIIDCAGLFQNQSGGRFRRDRYIPVTLSRGRGVSKMSLLIHSMVSPTLAEASAGEIARFSIDI
jgi:hypothetical protein